MPSSKGKFISCQILCSLKLNFFNCDFLNYAKLKNYYNNICTFINLGISRGTLGAVSMWRDVTLHKHSPFIHSIKLLLNIVNYMKLSFFSKVFGGNIAVRGNDKKQMIDMKTSRENKIIVTLHEGWSLSKRGGRWFFAFTVSKGAWAVGAWEQRGARWPRLWERPFSLWEGSQGPKRVKGKGTSGGKGGGV